MEWVDRGGSLARSCSEWSRQHGHLASTSTKNRRERKLEVLSPKKSYGTDATLNPLKLLQIPLGLPSMFDEYHLALFLYLVQQFYMSFQKV